MKAKAESLGFKEAPPDHPIYAEGPSITFLRGEKPPAKPCQTKQQES
jgi:hypothetical protein